MHKKLLASDWVILAYFLNLSLLVVLFVSPFSRALLYLGYHALLPVLMALLIHARHRYGGRFWTFLRYWYPVLLVLAAFREVHYLVPEIHPFDDWAMDQKLLALDVFLFGDVGETLRRFLWRPAVDLLSICYWSYFPMALALCAVLWRRGNRVVFRETISILILAWFVSFLGYYAIPALGPHVYEGHLGIPRDAAWDGLVIGAPLHQLLLELEWRTPDAFPSGHTLIALMCLGLSFRHHVLRPILPVFAVGIILATIYLRYHYVVDVGASFLLAPACWFGGMALARKCGKDPERRGINAEEKIPDS